MPKYNPAGYNRKMGGSKKKKPAKANFKDQMAKANKILYKRK